MTVGERPTRVMVTVVGLLRRAAPPGSIEQDLAAGTLTIALAVWALLALFGLGQLFGAVAPLAAPQPLPAAPLRRLGPRRPDRAA